LILKNLSKNAKDAAPKIAGASTKTKNNAIVAFARALKNQESVILAENAKDIAAGKQKGLSDALLDRLALNEARLAAMQKAFMKLLTCQILWAKSINWYPGLLALLLARCGFPSVSY